MAYSSNSPWNDGNYFLKSDGSYNLIYSKAEKGNFNLAIQLNRPSNTTSSSTSTRYLKIINNEGDLYPYYEVEADKPTIVSMIFDSLIAQSTSPISETFIQKWLIALENYSQGTAYEYYLDNTDMV